MKLLLKIITVLLVVFLCAYFSSGFLLELWWFSSLKLGSFFLLRESYAWLVSLGTTVVFTALVYANFSFIPRALGLGLNTNIGNKGLLALLQSRKKLLWLLSLLVVIPVLIPVYKHWESFLLFYFSVQAELSDPVYAKNISYYFFSYPVYELIQDQLLWVFAILLAVVSYAYFVSYKKRPGRQQDVPISAKWHVAVLLTILVMLQAWSIALERIEMLYESRHLPVFYGPGFVEMSYYLPLIWLSFLLFLGVAITAVYSLYTGSKRKLAMGFGLAYLLVLGVKNIAFIPAMIDEYYVSPNPVEADAKYIQYSIKATIDAFNLTDVKEVNYPLESSLTSFISDEISRELENIPLWDDDLLLPVYEQLQSIRPYYSFYHLAVDRYFLENANQQVNVAVRELDYQSLAVEAQNWRNEHLVYTYGYGVVMSSSHQQADQPMQWLLHDFGQAVEFDKLKLEQPKIYYGLADYPYAIVPNTESLKPAQYTAGDMSRDYQGEGGLPLSSLLAKAVTSAFFKDERIFFSAGINSKSRLLVRRNIYKRIKAIAPFLTLDQDAYPVIVNHKVYWIVDAFTATDRYPLVAPMTLVKSAKHKPFNYARNAVKIIVDAYNGSVDFYIVDEKDPLIKTYQRLYPSLFKDISAVPLPFIKHFSYPKAWFTLQMSIYSRFHQKDPEIFYQQSEALEFSRMEDEIVEPYYLTIDIDEHQDAAPEERQKFILVSPLSPLGRENLDSVAIAGCLAAVHCNEHYQEDIFIYKFSKEVQVEGPAQISALMNQNPDISRQFTLWGQRGSKVIRGRMIIIPIEHSLLYIQPLYLQSTAGQGFPALAKVVVAMNRQTVMANSLAVAFEKLQQKLMPKVEAL